MRLLVVCPPGGSFVIPVLQMFRGTLGLLRRGRLNLSMSICQQIRFSILLMFARTRALVLCTKVFHLPLVYKGMETPEQRSVSWQQS